ncbi:hypothetical protein FRACA_810022 [Frankia canadensis]|uniref:Uncharacterized protein n=1 Tax=Frankia canadensis TaxID=1836972 RepID=A0A2I2L1N2_9ACTN|nr:hypothetical protein FRACA_810022 [Frankia canadensis]SOU59121.1 hypothetical protein FRACA_810022 [Frankia canadensis]
MPARLRRELSRFLADFAPAPGAGRCLTPPRGRYPAQCVAFDVLGYLQVGRELGVRHPTMG